MRKDFVFHEHIRQNGEYSLQETSVEVVFLETRTELCAPKDLLALTGIMMQRLNIIMRVGRATLNLTLLVEVIYSVSPLCAILADSIRRML